MNLSFDNSISSKRPSTAKIQHSSPPPAPAPSLDSLLSENDFLKQQLADLRALYKELHETQVNIPQSKSQPSSQLLYKELRFEKARRMQMERMLHRLQKANDTRRECLAEIENFALEVKAMADDAESQALNVQYLKKWTESFVMRIRSYHLQTSKAEKQGLFLPGTGYLDESALDLEGLTIMEIAQGRMQDVPYLNTYNLAMLENKLNDLYRYTCKLGNTVKYSLLPSHYSHEQQVVQNVALSDAQMLCKQIDEVRRELTLLGAVVPSKFDNSTTKSEPLSYLSLNTKELMKKLPKYSRYPAECETSLRALSKCLNNQKHVWNLEKEMLQEEVTFHEKVAHFFKTYTAGMLKQIDQMQRRMLPTPEQPTPSSADASCLRDLYERFTAFDRDSNEENLRYLLLCFKTNGDQIQHLIDESNTAAPPRNIQRDLAQFAREIEVLEEEHRLQMESILGRKYELEEDLMQREMFMNFKPYMVPVRGEERGASDFYKVDSQQSSVGTGGEDRFQAAGGFGGGAASETSSVMSADNASQQSFHSHASSSTTTKPAATRKQRSARGNLSTAHAAVLSEDTPLITSDERVARATRKTRPPVSKQEKKQTSSLPPNLVELQDIVEDSRIKLEEMTDRLENEQMTSMQQYALKKEIARERAKLKKNERTLNSMLE